MPRAVPVLVLFALTSAVVALDNGVGTTPMMGWMAWIRFRCNIVRLWPWCAVQLAPHFTGVHWCLVPLLTQLPNPNDPLRSPSPLFAPPHHRPQPELRGGPRQLCLGEAVQRHRRPNGGRRLARRRVHVRESIRERESVCVACVVRCDVRVWVWPAGSEIVTSVMV